MFCAHGLIFGGSEGVMSRVHLLPPGLILGGTEGVDPIFMFCPLRLVFGGTEGIGSLFYVLRSRTRFRQCRGRWVPFSCFPLPDSFLALPRASVSVFLFCAAGLVFGVTEGVWSYFHVLRSRTRFRRFRVPRVPFSCFVRPYSFSAEPRVSDPVFMFYAPALVFHRTEGVVSLFHVLRSRMRFGQFQGRRVPFSCFAL
jgi:hypothetical protein